MRDSAPDPPDRGLGWTGIFIMTGVVSVLAFGAWLLTIVRNAGKSCVNEVPVPCWNPTPVLIVATVLAVISAAGLGAALRGRAFRRRR